MGAAGLERKLAAVLVGDLKGFTRLLAEDELLALREVGDFRALVREQVKTAHGVLLEASDGFQAHFASIQDAARCAIELQRRLMRSREDRPGEQRLVARMGLAVGEVIHYEREFFGAAVNLAFHVARFAPPGGIAIPATAAEQLGASREFEFGEFGERSLRGIAKPVLIRFLRTGVEIESAETDAEPQRRLAAILEADVVGWSLMMATREAETVAAITVAREAMAERVLQRRGRVVDSTGDNLLAEFRSALDAVLCAIEIQREHAARNAELAEDERLEFRVGIHLSDVRVDGQRIYGSGVNIAARLEALAAPGGVCISASVHEQVRYHLDIEFRDLGEQELKNIPHPVRAFGFGGSRMPAATPTLYARLKRRLSGPPAF